jgi:4-hydroxy-4-methyl-2-oxoglutarate aldolase
VPRVVTNVTRTDAAICAGFAGLGVATAHEAQERTGLLNARIQARQAGSAVAGPALTCEVPPGDNWMIHVALEQAQPGDVLVVSPTSPCGDGYFGDLLATSALARGIRGLVIDAGVRDLAALRAMGFPVWSKTVSAQGTVKQTTANVQVPLVCADALVTPGDVIVADDDGVCVVARIGAQVVLDKARQRAEAEEVKRGRYASGRLGLDIGGLRSGLKEKGLVYE